MKLLEITLHNFMPYKGDQTVYFPRDPSRNVMVVFGQNMRGKTSFFNAIRWCLYGQALDRDRREIGIIDLLNMDARQEGDWQVSVFLKFEANGVEYDLRRIAVPKEYISAPRRDSDFDIQLKLRKKDVVVRGDEIEHEINQLMPQQVSRFFLFDAELLAEYQELLTDDSEQGKRIKHAIEQVLGVPALLNGKAEMRTLLKKSQDVLAKENRHSEGMRAQAEQFARLQGELESLNKDMADLKSREDVIKKEISDLDALLNQTEAAQKAHTRLEGLKAEVRNLKERAAHLRTLQLDLISDAWKDLLQPRLQAHISRLERERSGFQAKIEQRGALLSRIDQLKKILEMSVCAVCEQPISPAQREQFGAILGGLEADLSASKADLERVGQLTAEISRLSRIGASGASARLRGIESDLNRNAVDLTRAEELIAEEEEKIRGFDTAEVARQRSRRDHLLQHWGRLQEEISVTQREIDERMAKQDQLSRLMMKAPNARTERSAKEVEIYSALEKLFSRSVDILRDRLKESVAELATQAFLRLTTEKTYSGLRINENYGLTILDRDRRPVSIRSAGAEQIVALSLIDGLNRTARKTGPIIIDTPLGRLDPTHRSNVLHYVPEMADQVVLLVHEGEIDKATGLNPLADRIGAMYEIDRVSSSHSVITKQ